MSQGNRRQEIIQIDGNVIERRRRAPVQWPSPHSVALPPPPARPRRAEVGPSLSTSSASASRSTRA